MSNHLLLCLVIGIFFSINLTAQNVITLTAEPDSAYWDFQIKKVEKNDSSAIKKSIADSLKSQNLILKTYYPNPF